MNIDLRWSEAIVVLVFISARLSTHEAHDGPTDKETGENTKAENNQFHDELLRSCETCRAHMTFTVRGTLQT